LAYRGTASGEISLAQNRLDEKLAQVIQTGQTVIDDDGATINLPISIRGRTIGVIRLRKPQHMDSWNDDELQLARELIDELGSAVDGARLYKETQQRADRERIVGEITNRMRETMDIESVIRTAADEIYNVIDLDHVTIQLLSETDDKHTEEPAS
ncbi:MAG: GAF domain-containing protein, partial [Anaerolineales bacterium]|nr:GAF domain-containing protein [Anaerolineales bacterium]